VCRRSCTLITGGASAPSSDRHCVKDRMNRRLNRSGLR
jgi:hypothetical protein